MTVSHPDPRLPYFLDTIVIAWIGGFPSALTDSWSRRLPGPDGPVHVIAAANPHGQTVSDEENRGRHAQLLRTVDDLAGVGRSPEAIRWWPAVATSPDGAHTEPSVVLAGLSRADAVALGLQFEQLAVFELTDEVQGVVPCVDSASGAETLRHRHLDGEELLISDQIERWWADHAEAATTAGIDLGDRPTCPRCGSERLAELIFGMPSGPPPPWIELGGCIVGPEAPRLACIGCGARF